MTTALYIANKNYSSWSLRPWVLMRMLDIRFSERLVPFGSGADAFRAFSPTGRVPCLVSAGVAVWDSLAITEYLAERHPGVWPLNVLARTWARCATAEMHSSFGGLRERCTFNCGIRVDTGPLPAAVQADLERLDALWCEGLRKFDGPFLAGGDFGAVDAFFAPVAFRIQTYRLRMSEPALAYASRLRELAPMREWEAAALRETWRDEAHEAEARAAGTWLEDLRATA